MCVHVCTVCFCVSTAFSFVASTLSVFLLYVVHEEAVVVVMLCIFTALSTPAWNDSSLIIAEVYPTHLRYCTCINRLCVLNIKII